jgi:NTE family protein
MPLEMAEAVAAADLQVVPNPEANRPHADLAVMLTGGGARAAYQAGLLCGLSRHFPNLNFDVITGVSAGAINAIFLACHEGTLAEKAEKLANMWRELECFHIFKPNYTALMPFQQRKPHGFFNAGPLATLLRRVFDCPKRGMPIAGIKRNINRGDLKAVALISLDYSTGQNVRWAQGRSIDVFDGPNRRSVDTEITVEHVLASAALPLVFPAVKIGSRWYGDGGIRLSAPLSPAVHLGASRILAMSTGYQRTPDEADVPVVSGYPPAAQILGQLFNAVFLDAIDEDVTRMQRMSEILRQIPEKKRGGLKPIDLHVLRPSRDIGRLAKGYEQYLPKSMKMFTGALGSGETESPDFISMLMFEPNYLSLLIEIGQNDVEKRLPELSQFLNMPVSAAK